MDNGTTGQTAAPTEHPRTAWLASFASPAGMPFLVGLAGVVFYLGLRTATSRFYDRFGLKPEDVGLDYITVLTRSVAGLVPSLLFVAAFAGLAWAFKHRVPTLDTVTVLVEGSTGGVTTVLRWVALLALCVLAAVVASGLTLLWAPLGLLVAIAVLIAYFASLLRTVSEDRALRSRALRFRRPLAVFSFAAYMMLGPFNGFMSTANEDASSVRSGHVPTSSWGFGVKLYPWDATTACVAIPDDRRGGTSQCARIPRRSHRRCVMFLGEGSK